MLRFRRECPIGAIASVWKSHLAATAEIKLAMESEWGKRNNSAHSLNMILFDAAKLAAIRATSKVMVFASQRGSDRQDIVDALMTLRTQWDDPSPWLWIDVPWNHSTDFPVTHGVFEKGKRDRSGTGPIKDCLL
jgi:hypothetical protein